MLVHTEIETIVTTAARAHFFWTKRVEFSHDCFVCRRRGRTVLLDHGASEGRCLSTRKPAELVGRGIHSYEDVSFIHPAPVRISGFDVAESRTDDVVERTLRCRITSWWAPFQDAKDPDEAGTVPTAYPWVRLEYTVGCFACYDNGHTEALSRTGGIQSNLVLPSADTCPTCGQTLLTADSGPKITLVV
ncbi:hypothetical protein [Actinokineospora sp. HUAS TT18]|uniref:hypothetical protein n=1 Tax=Actinokineospora sp. HUAS TT18 TaxID=3447451 RepID=UPI003F528779